MMRRPTAQPGNIRYQVGKSLNAIRDSIDAYDLVRMVHHVHLLYSLASPKAKLDTVKLPSAMGLSDVDADGYDEQVTSTFEACMIALRAILSELSREGIYAVHALQEEDATGYDFGLQ